MNFFKAVNTSNGIYNEDLPNSWECPKCCKEGKNLESKVCLNENSTCTK